MFRLLTWLNIILFTFCVKTSLANDIVTGKSYLLKSSVLEEDRNYTVYLPVGYQKSVDKHYPVIYLLDGDSTLLKGFSGIVEYLSSGKHDVRIPEFIIVAIPNTNRTRDLTPTKTDLIFKGKLLAELGETGGADDFIKFIKTDLMPTISKNYRTNGKKTLVGMSFGGLFTAHVLMTQPEIFDDYLIADATYVWDDNYLSKLSLDPIKVSTKEISVFLALANNDHIGEHGVMNRQWGGEFIEKLKLSGIKNLDIKSEYFANESHGTIEMLAWYHGLVALYRP